MPIPDKVIEKVVTDKRIIINNNETTIEHEEKVKITPESKSTKSIEIKKIDLVISVKSMFGKNARELALIQKGLGPVFAGLLLFYAYITNRVETVEDVVWLFIMSLCNSVGIPVIDGISNLTNTPEQDEPDGSNGSNVLPL